jgi:hypothetical protein
MIHLNHRSRVTRLIIVRTNANPIAAWRRGPAASNRFSLRYPREKIAFVAGLSGFGSGLRVLSVATDSSGHRFLFGYNWMR